METNNDKKYPQGHFLSIWMAIGIAIFSGFGIPLSIVTQNYGLIGVGPALGVAFGLSIGQAIEKKYQREGRIRALTEMEEKRKKIAIVAGLAVLTLGVIVFLLLLFL